MLKSRFLRDHVLDGMIEDVKLNLNAIDRSDPANAGLYNYTYSLFVTFRTNKVVLSKIEECIEFSRKNNPSDRNIALLSETIMHIHAEIVSLYEALRQNTTAQREPARRGES